MTDKAKTDDVVDRLALTEIKITPEMIEAGHDEMSLNGPLAAICRGDWLERTYLRMRKLEIDEGAAGNEGDVAALLSDLRKGKLGRKPGDPVRDEFDRHIRTVQRLVHPPAAQDDRLRIAVEALEPFAAFAENVDAEGWTSNIHRERISVWFGPSDFRRAREALAALKPTAPQEGEKS